MSLYEKFGLRIPVSDYLASLKSSQAPGSTEDSQRIVASSVPHSRFLVALCYYLLGDVKMAREHGEKISPETLDFFYGPWRGRVKTEKGTYDAEWWLNHIMWMDHFSYALCWASSLGDWTSVNRLAQFPNESRELDSEATNEDKAFYVCLAALLRCESFRNYPNSLSQITAGTKQRPKLLLAVLESLEAKDYGGFQANMDAYLKYFRKREFNRRSMDKLMSLDGTTLYHLGRREGWNYNIPPEGEDHVIRLS